MARIREVLGRSDSTRNPPPFDVPAPRPYQPPGDSGTTATSAQDEEIPFIEVGGRNTPLEASPSVLAHSPKPVIRKLQVEPTCASQPSDRAGARLTQAAEDRPRSVAFLPFPPEPSPLGPVSERFDRELVAAHDPDHPLSEQYRAVVAGLEKQLTAGQSQALLLTATDPAIDTAGVLLNLAITRARQGETPTIVVDADSRRNTLAERLGLPAAPGLKNVAGGLISLPRAVQETGQPNLYALTAGKTVPESIPPIASESLRGVLRYLRGRFGWILVNAPCWDGRPEVITLVSACDAVYLVVPKAAAQTDTVEAVSQAILQQGGCLQGYILVGEEQ